MPDLSKDLTKAKNEAITALQAYRNALTDYIESGAVSKSYLYKYINYRIETDKLIADLINDL